MTLKQVESSVCLRCHGPITGNGTRCQPCRELGERTLLEVEHGASTIPSSHECTTCHERYAATSLHFPFEKDSPIRLGNTCVHCREKQEKAEQRMRETQAITPPADHPDWVTIKDLAVQLKLPHTSTVTRVGKLTEGQEKVFDGVRWWVDPAAAQRDLEENPPKKTVASPRDETGRFLQAKDSEPEPSKQALPSLVAVPVDPEGKLTEAVSINELSAYLKAVNTTLLDTRQLVEKLNTDLSELDGHVSEARSSLSGLVAGISTRLETLEHAGDGVGFIQMQLDGEAPSLLEQLPVHATLLTELKQQADEQARILGVTIMGGHENHDEERHGELKLALVGLEQRLVNELQDLRQVTTDTNGVLRRHEYAEMSRYTATNLALKELLENLVPLKKLWRLFRLRK